MPDEETQRDKLEEILYPSDQAKAFKITLVFPYKVNPGYEKAVALASQSPTYRTEGAGEFIRHQATYTPDEVEELFSLFSLVHDWPETEVLVNHKKLPYGHQLWLPLMWFYRVR
jgi:hypothetical protein